MTVVGSSLMFHSLELGEVLPITLLLHYDSLGMRKEMVPMMHLSNVWYLTTKATSKAIVKGSYELGEW